VVKARHLVTPAVGVVVLPWSVVDGPIALVDTDGVVVIAVTEGVVVSIDAVVVS